MEEILEKANDLGLLIKKTEAARDFREKSSLVESSSDASLLLKQYNELAETLRVKQEAGFIIESYETEQFALLSEAVLSDDILREYISARDRYMEMLIVINNQLSI